MTQTAIMAVTLIGCWLGLGLAFEACLALRQWRHLAAATADDRAIRYGQYRALFDWLVKADLLVRIALWASLSWWLTRIADVTTWPFGLIGPAVVGFALIDFLLRQPLTWARWYWLDVRRGVARTDASIVLGDAVRKLGLELAVAIIALPWLGWPFLLAGPLLAWPMAGVCLLAGIGVFYWVRPNVVAPWFNRFEPLPDGELRTRLQAMMARCGTQLDTVLVMNHSRRSALANAYFTGLGRHKRIVLFDTLIERLTPAELEAVMAHELGHFRCGHLRRYYGLLAGLLLCAVVIGGWTGDALDLAPVVTAIGLYLLLPALAWPLMPWRSALRRRYEYEADDYAVRNASRDGLIAALEKLLAGNLNAPTMDGWYAMFYATHPPGNVRLARLQPVH